MHFLMRDGRELALSVYLSFVFEQNCYMCTHVCICCVRVCALQYFS